MTNQVTQSIHNKIIVPDVPNVLCYPAKSFCAKMLLDINSAEQRKKQFYILTINLFGYFRTKQLNKRFLLLKYVCIFALHIHIYRRIHPSIKQSHQHFVMKL